jgi:hypothetical protein
MIPLQLGGLPIPVGQGPLMIGALVFGVLLIAVTGGAWFYFRDDGDPWDEFIDAAHHIVETEDADAIVLMPYSDGPLLPKPGIYDRELLGGKGGYRTPDGDRVYVDGQGNGSYSLGGVDVVLAIDPTEHAAAADPLKAWVTHKKDLGEWIKADREGNVIEAGEALQRLDGDPTAMDIDKQEAQQAVADGGDYPSQVHEKAIEDGMTLEDAKAQLEQAGMLEKIVDLAPPREAVVDEDGEVHIEEATHAATPISKAADLLPKKTNTTAWQTMEEKARQEGMDEEKIKEHITYGLVLGAGIAGVLSGVFLLFFMFM